jgi:ElaB/YqjD/DUF883 family membrane-anchored ribosome-binding protein
MTDTKPLEQFGDERDRVESYAREAANVISDAKARVSDTISDVADQVRQTASQVTGGRSVSSLANDAADRVAGAADRAADYLRDTEPQDMWDDVTKMVKSRPVEFVAAAAVLGFFLGRIARRT